MIDTPVTVLLDLDDTLLQNDIGRFLPAYFQAIRGWLAEVIPGDGFMDAFLEASQVMLVNDRPDATLAQAFYGHFLPRIDLPYADLMPVVERFYTTAYPQLRSLTAPAPGAREAVRILHEAGHRLVVATNPLFPAAAIHQRLDWAGLDLDRAGFDLVTTFERFHFAKPNPAYYAEILASLGWPEGPAVMVGDDAINDIRAAGELGLATYQLDDRDPVEDQPSERHGGGRLADFPAWLANRDPEALLPDHSSIDAVLAVLKSTPAALQTLVSETDPEAWRIRIDGEWTAVETLAHLRDVEAQVNLVRVETFLRSDNPFITGVDTNRWHADGFGVLPPVESVLEGFLKSRLETLDLLAEIPRPAWRRPARHSIFGPTDLLEIAGIMAGHDQGHVRQIRATCAAGPPPT